VSATERPLETAVSHGLNLVLKLNDRSKLGELMRKIHAKQERIREVLGRLKYLHFSRFLPVWEDGTLLVITEFDGDFDDYVMDFAADLSEEFSMMLEYMRDAPPLPVHLHPREFLAYVQRNSNPQLRSPVLPAHRDPACPYPNKTVLDILGEAAYEQHVRLGPRTEVRHQDGQAVKREDIQANVLQRYRAQVGVHVPIRFVADEEEARAVAGRAVLGALNDGGLAVTWGAQWKPDKKPDYCLNVGLTYAGLETLGLDRSVLGAFPKAFREGPAARAGQLDDTDGDGAPKGWLFGAAGPEIHALISIYAGGDDEAKAEATLERCEAALRELMAGKAERISTQDLDARLKVRTLDPLGREVHFGYADGVSQLAIELGPVKKGEVNSQPYEATKIPAGDVLLGGGLVNSRSGNHIGGLPSELADHATYAAFRVIDQDVEAFDGLLQDVAKTHKIDPELVAARLMGRWKNGAPLIKHPTAKPEKYDPSDEKFDYGFDTGLVCPMGAHARRLNPRRGLVVGVPTGRNLIRRGMPYGARNDKVQGLAGLFICADLESQFEFVLRTWANRDLSAPGLAGTRDPFVGSPLGDKASFRMTSTEVVAVPRLTQTVGSLYLFMPGRSGLKCLATPRSKRAAPLQVIAMPGSPGFRADPYPFYREQRSRDPLFKLPKDASTELSEYWLLSSDLIAEVTREKDVFQKPDWPNGMPHHIVDNGVLYMNGERHAQTRAILEPALEAATHGVEEVARQIARQLITELQDEPTFKQSGAFDVVHHYAKPLAMKIFRHWMGFPERMERLIEPWVAQMMRARVPSASGEARFGGGSASNAVYLYFHSLMDAVDPGKFGGRVSVCPMVQSLKNLTSSDGKPHDDKLQPDEAMVTALHFVLGGYESLAFLVTSGTFHLLRHPQEMAKLRAMVADRQMPDDERLQRLDDAIDEMLRYDPPLAMIDRVVVAKDGYDLGPQKVKLVAGDKVQLVYASANRGIDVEGDAEAFVIDRKSAFARQRHPAFGNDAHYCIGAQLARKLGRIAFEELIGGFDTLLLVHAGEWLPDISFRSLESLLVSTKPN
jgi:cytochrome P450/deferrochelatase/peroxidase EfeB